MKTLSTHITESLFGNLGIGASAVRDEWIDKYNNSIANASLVLDCKAYAGNGDDEIIIEGPLYIRDSILENGHLPEYFNFTFMPGRNEKDRSLLGQTVIVHARDFTSFEGITLMDKAKIFFIFLSYDNLNNNIDLGTIPNLPADTAVDLHINTIHNFRLDLNKLKQPIHKLDITAHPTPEDLIGGVKGLNFVKVGNTYPIFGIYTSKGLYKDTRWLSKFFKNNKFATGTKVQLSGLKAIDYDFVKNINFKVNTLSIPFINPQTDGPIIDSPEYAPLIGMRLKPETLLLYNVHNALNTAQKNSIVKALKKKGFFDANVFD